MRWIRALAAVAAIAAIVIFPPVLLLTFIGSPIPAGLGFTTQLTDRALIQLLSIIVWLFWAQTVWCMVAEVIAASRSAGLARVPGTFGVQQHFARVLIGTIVAAVVVIPGLPATTAIASPGASGPSPSVTTETSGSMEAEETATSAAPDEGSHYGLDSGQSTVIVERGDTLWAIAEKHLGNGELFVEIAAANEGRRMIDGKTFHGSDAIQPGWVLAIPGDPQADTTNTHDATYTVQPGDTLSEIAQEHLGNASAWPKVFQDSQKLDQPVPLTSPDLIYPGQKVDLRSAASRSPQNQNQSSETELLSSSPDIDKRDGESSGSPRGIDGKRSEPHPVASETGESLERAETDIESGSLLPDWVMPGLLGGGTLLAGSVLIALKRRRAAQYRIRRPGRTLGATDPELTVVEKSVTVVGSTTTSTIDLIDHLLKRLASSLTARDDALPNLAAVEVTDTAVALHLTQTENPPGAPWSVSDDGLLWVVDKNVDLDTVGPDPVDSPAPWPLLVTIGHDDQDGIWILNLEDLNVDVTGDHVAAEDFARFIAAEIACNPWSKHTSLDVVGIANEIASVDPHRIHAHDRTTDAASNAVAEAVNTIDRLKEQNLNASTVRARQQDPDPWPSRLVIVGHHENATALTQLIELLGSHRGRTATAVVRTATESPDHFTIDIDERRQLTIPSVNLTIKAVGLTVDEAHGCAALLAQAEQTEDSPAPNMTGDRPWKAMTTTTGSLRDQYKISRQANTLEVSGSLLEKDDDDYTAVAATTREDLEALAPKVAESVRHQVAAADPDLDADLQAWDAADCARPRLTLLGPVGARTSGVAMAKGRPYLSEMLAYLTTRPYGATNDEVAAAFGISGARVRNVIKDLRAWLGVNPITGETFLPDARKAPAAMQRGVGVYQVTDTLVDADLFRRLRLRGESRGPKGIEDLNRALQLVKGEPFGKLRKGGWGWMFEGDRMDQHLVCAIVDVAHIVVTHGLCAGDLELARTAADVAVAAAPHDEIARLDNAAVLEAEGHTSAAARIIRDDVCNRADGGEAPIELPNRTEQIIETRQWLQHSAI